MYSEFVHCHVVRNTVVDNPARLVKDCLQLFLRDVILLHHLVVGIYQSDKLIAFRYDDRLSDILLIIDHRFDLLRKDVLSGRPEEHAFAPALYEYVPIVVNHTQVAGMHPSLLVDHLPGGFLILVISLHDILPAENDLPYLVNGVGRIDRHFEGINGAARGTELRRIPRCIADEWPAFSHPVSYSESEPDLLKESLSFGVKCGASYHDLVESPSECLGQLLPYLLMQDCIDPGDREQYLHVRFGNDRKELLLEYLFYYKRYRQNESRPDLLESLYDDLR